MADDRATPPEAKRSHSDALWQPREPVQVEKTVAQYSRFVGRVKIALPVAAGVILLLVLLIPQFRGETDRFRIGLKKVTDLATDSLSMIGARYFGTDENGQPFNVTADSARERAEATAEGVKLIDLAAPRAEFSAGKDGARVTVSATNGVYDRKQEGLDLGGEVVVTQKDYEMKTSGARVNLKDRSATGDQPVTVTGNFGEIKGSKGFIARQGDNVVTFKGPGTMVLKNSKPTDGNDKPQGTQP